MIPVWRGAVGPTAVLGFAAFNGNVLGRVGGVVDGVLAVAAVAAAAVLGGGVTMLAWCASWKPASLAVNRRIRS